MRPAPLTPSSASAFSDEAHLEYVPLSEAKKADRNPKEHDLPGIRAALRRFGFVDPLVEDAATGKLVAGHGRCEALEQAKAAGEEPPTRIRVRDDGEWLVPVLRGIHFKSPAEAEAYLIASNQLPVGGGWNDEGLGAILADFTKLEVPLDGLGFSESQVRRLVGIPAVASLTSAVSDTPELTGFEVIVSCKTKKERTALLKKLGADGYDARPHKP